MFAARLLPRLEGFVKGVLFDCRVCGQCVLRHTGLVCPMRCPKGLRNGPCGGTLGGRCEVYPERECVWVAIHRRRPGGAPLPLLEAPDPALFFTSSYANRLAGRDVAARAPLPSLELPAHRTAQPARTASGLERRLRAGRFVRTCELTPPPHGDLGAFRDKALQLRGRFDAVNVTAFVQGAPHVPSPVAAAELVRLGVEPIVHATARDHTRTSFVAELIANDLAGVHNVLCLTGDYATGAPPVGQGVGMDSALMLYEARHLAGTGTVRFTGRALARPPRPFLGAAINPFSDPPAVPVRRLRQKLAAGPDFVQTQMVFDLPRFRAFMERCRDHGLHREVFLIAGVPVVLSEGAWRCVSGLPGIHIPADVRARLDGAADLKTEGMRLARELIAALCDMPGVAGVHLMAVRGSPAALLELADFADGLRRPGQAPRCPPAGPARPADAFPVSQGGSPMRAQSCGFYYLGPDAVGTDCRDFCIDRYWCEPRAAHSRAAPAGEKPASRSPSPTRPRPAGRGRFAG